MAKPQEIPGIVTELVDMSREYLRQETVEPAKKLGKHAGLGVGGGLLMAIGAVCAVWGSYYLFQILLPEGAWWVVLSRTLAFLVAVIGVGLVAWRMQVDDQ